MSTIDIHTHFIPPFVFAETSRDVGMFGVRKEGQSLVYADGFRHHLNREFVDADAKLAQMDSLGIDISVLSSSPTLFFYEERAPEAVAFARRSNDALAELVHGHTRLYGLAALPLQAPAAAALELERAVKELGFLGAQIGSTCGNNRRLDERELEPVLDAAETLGVPLMIHPYYVGSRPGLDSFYLANSIGNPLETCIAAARLMYAGTLDRFPELKIVLVHGGGFMPYQLGRLDHAFVVRAEAKEKTKTSPSNYLSRFWMDSITHSDQSLRFLVDLVGTDRVVLGSDLPFDMADGQPVERVRRAEVDPDALGATAAKIFGIESHRKATEN
jgi:aminocarboxymuconate-semialdehyde decarboxylase